MDGTGEVNRLKELPKNYNVDLFNHYYKTMTPLIKKLVRQIDERRFNVDKSIIQSWFYDKLLYVFTKYYDLHDTNPEKFKATIISSLMLLKNRTLRNAYSKTSENLYQALDRFDDAFESNKEDIPDLDDDEILRRERISDIHDFMREHCSPDAYILFQLQMNPPPYFINRLTNPTSPISTSLILNFFEKPINQTYVDYISRLRKEIALNIEKAREEFN